jgi:hypothetical protein
MKTVIEKDKMQNTIHSQSDTGSSVTCIEIMILAVTTLISVVLTSYILIEGLLNHRGDTKIVPDGTTIEQVDTVLKGLSDIERAQFSQALRAEIAARPLNVQPVKNLAALYQTGKVAEEGNAIVILAADWVKRDLALQTSAFKLELEQKNFVDAIRRLNIIYLTQPKSQNDVLKTLVGFISPVSLAALVDALAKKPVWRRDFILSLSGNTSVKTNAIYVLFSSLRKAGSPATQVELRLFLQRLISESAYDKAYFVWLDSVDAQSLRKVGLINDGAFDLQPSNMFFTWTLYEIPNVDARVMSRNLGSVDKIFRIAFQPARTNYNGFIQYLQLTPGSYSLTGESKSDALATPVGLVWRVNCVNNVGEVLAETKPFSGNTPWTPFETAFDVPQEGCKTQILRLQVNAKTDLDTQISGQAQFDNISIKRKAK